MRLPRFRIRTLIIAVAVVGLVLAGFRLGQRSRDFHQQAVWWGSMEAIELSMRAKGAELARAYYEEERIKGKTGLSGTKTAAGTPTILVQGIDEDSIASRMRRKYEYATWHPWVDVEPDPPFPWLQ